MFSIAMTIFSCKSLKYVSMSNQKCKIRLSTIKLIAVSLYFILTIFLYINVVADAMILISLMLHYVFLMVLKIWTLKYLISCQELMKQNMYLGIRLVHENVD